MNQARIWPRIAAFLIDTMILMAIVSVIMVLHTKVFVSLPPVWLQVIEWSIPVMLFLYFIILEAAYGTTIGKSIFKIKVVKLDGSKISVGQSIGRNLARLFNGFFSIDYLIGLVDKKHQRLGDRLANTLVIEADRRDVTIKTFLAIVGSPIILIFFMLFNSWITSDSSDKKYSHYFYAKSDFEFGMTYMSEGDDDMISSFTNCIQAIPTHITARYARYLCNLEKKKDIEAKKDLEEILVIDPNNSKANIAMAKYYNELNFNHKAIKYIDAAKKGGEDLLNYYEAKAKILDEMDKKGEARKYARQADKLKSKYEGLPGTIDEHLREGKFDEVGLMIEKRISEEWNIAGFIYRKGLLAFLKKDYEKALKEYDKCLLIDPTFEPSYVYRGYLRFIMDKKEEAFDDLMKFYAIKEIVNPIYYMRFVKDEDKIKVMLAEYKEHKQKLREEAQEESGLSFELSASEEGIETKYKVNGKEVKAEEPSKEKDIKPVEVEKPIKSIIKPTTIPTVVKKKTSVKKAKWTKKVAAKSESQISINYALDKPLAWSKSRIKAVLKKYGVDKEHHLFLATAQRNRVSPGLVIAAYVMGNKDANIAAKSIRDAINENYRKSKKEQLIAIIVKLGGPKEDLLKWDEIMKSGK
jgi:uncharacterized RDD family membrane protein YckC/tetratricopeptide (TPR) repeat protein